MVARTDLQRAADAAAHAAVLEFRSEDGPAVIFPSVRNTRQDDLLMRPCQNLASHRVYFVRYLPRS
jgi:hypothetical protein